jgi:hypothetical protein
VRHPVRTLQYCMSENQKKRRRHRRRFSFCCICYRVLKQRVQSKVLWPSGARGAPGASGKISGAWGGGRPQASCHQPYSTNHPLPRPASLTGPASELAVSGLSARVCKPTSKAGACCRLCRRRLSLFVALATNA